MPGLRGFSLWLLLLPIFSSAVMSDTQGLPSVVGSAYDQTTGYLLYTEYHFCTATRERCTVQYRDSYGDLIARKELDFRSSPIAPGLTLINYRSDEVTRVIRDEPENLVVDAGFDNFIRTIWDDLDGGKSARFPFLVAGFDKPFNMRATRAATTGCTRKQLCLEIKLDSWLLGMLASPIELLYSRESRQLLRFSGVSNMKGVNGEALNVNILYTYGDELLMAGPLHQQSTEYTF